jgi:hypothetical protein
MKYNGIVLIILGLLLVISAFIKNDNSKELNYTSIVGGVTLIAIGGLYFELSKK